MPTRLTRPLACTIACIGIPAAALLASDPAKTTPESEIPVERITTECTANTWTGSTQYEPALAADREGRVLVAWASRRQEDGAFGVFAQLFDPLGRAIGTETHVNTHIEGAQASPAVAFDPVSGGALIVWESSHQDGSGLGIVGRWFDATAQGLEPDSDEFPINTTRQGDQWAPSVAINSSGVAMIAWTQGSGIEGSSKAQLLGADREPIGGEFTLGGERAHAPQVAAMGSDRFLAVGASKDAAGNPDALWMQRISAEGEAGEPKPVAAEWSRTDIEPSLGVAEDGRATIAWMRRGARGYNVALRRFDAQGEPLAPETTIRQSGEQWLSGVSVAVAPAGEAIVSWNEEDRVAPDPEEGEERESRDSDVLAVRFGADGVPMGRPAIVNTTLKGQQRLSIGSTATRTLWTAQDQIIHAWCGATDRDPSGIGLTLSRPVGLSAPEPLAVTPKPAITPAIATSFAGEQAAPVFDPNWTPEPPDVNVRGIGPDFGFLGTQSTGWRPPDPEMAVGPDHCVVVVNAQIVFRRLSDGVATHSQSLLHAGGFWGAQGAGGFVFDPIAQFDTHSNRFVVAATERAGGQEYINIAISDDDDPNGNWNKFRVNVSSFGSDIDYPIMGIDEDTISITVDFFGSPIGNWIMIFDKADLIAGTLTMQGVQSAGGPNALGAMTNYDPGAPALYFVTTYFGGTTQLLLKAVTDPLGAPTLHELPFNVPMYLQPPGAEQQGSTNLVSTVDFRVKHGVVRNGAMWFSHSTNDPDGEGPFTMDPVARIRWYEIELNGWPTSGMNPTLTQSGTIDEGEGIHLWNADLSVDDQGNAGIVYSRSSLDEPIAVARSVRRVTDPPGTFRQSVRMQLSTTPEPEDRWGDYAGIQEDPDEPGVFWGHNEYRTSSWRTWVGRFSAVDPNPLDFALELPADGALEVPLAATLDWEDAQDADSYEVAVATDPDLINTVAIMTVTESQWTVPNGALDCGVEYFWGVLAISGGGSTDATPGVFSFTTGLLEDINGDDVVDTADLGLLIGAFGSGDEAADLNNDGIVDTADLGLLIGAFGASCG